MANKQHDISATDFREPLLRALLKISESKPNRPVSCRHTYTPICNEMGITRGQYGEQGNTGINRVEKWIQWAFRALREEGLGVKAGRGQWALTPSGVKEAQQLPEPAAPQEKVVDTTSTMPPVSLAVGPGMDDSRYHPDPYIRALAAEATKCYGHYTDKDTAMCSRCPLSGSCQKALAARMSLLAHQLADEDKQRTNGLNKKVEPEPEPKPEPTRSGKDRWGKGQEITIQTDAICECCKQALPKNTLAIWVRSGDGAIPGVFHPDCYKGDSR